MIYSSYHISNNPGLPPALQRAFRYLARPAQRGNGARSLSQPHGAHPHGISSQLCALQRDDFRHQRWQLFRVSLLEEARHLRVETNGKQK